METYSELGDLSAQGSDQSAGDSSSEASINMLNEAEEAIDEEGLNFDEIFNKIKKQIGIDYFSKKKKEEDEK